MEKEKVKFVHNNMHENGERLVKHFGIKRVENVPVINCTVIVNDRFTTYFVRDGWYTQCRTVLLILYLTEGNGDEIFPLTASKRQQVLEFFGPDICRDAMKNTLTYPMLTLLLQKASVRVSVSLEPDH